MQVAATVHLVHCFDDVDSKLLAQLERKTEIVLHQAKLAEIVAPLQYVVQRLAKDREDENLMPVVREGVVEEQDTLAPGHGFQRPLFVLHVLLGVGLSQCFQRKLAPVLAREVHVAEPTLPKVLPNFVGVDKLARSQTARIRVKNGTTHYFIF